MSSNIFPIHASHFKYKKIQKGWKKNWKKLASEKIETGQSSS